MQNHHRQEHWNTPRKGNTRPSLFRLQQIDEILKAGKFLSAKKIGKRLGVSGRTIVEDIAHMRYFHKAPIEYDAKRFGYYYTEDFHFLPAAPVSEAELFSVLVAHKAIAQYRGTQFEQPLEAAFKKLANHLDKRKVYSLQNQGSAVSFRPFAPADADLELFRAITRALHDHLMLEFKYRNFNTLVWQKRRVRPYHLACIDNVWYLFAYDLKRKAIRKFVLARFKDAVVTEESFIMPKDFDPEKYLRNCFTVMGGEKLFKVVVEFDLWGSDIVRCRKWHSSQVLEDLPKGCCRVQITVNSLEEIERWILSFGFHARVIGPKILRRRIRKIILAMDEMYADC